MGLEFVNRAERVQCQFEEDDEEDGREEKEECDDGEEDGREEEVDGREAVEELWIDS